MIWISFALTKSPSRISLNVEGNFRSFPYSRHLRQRVTWLRPHSRQSCHPSLSWVPLFCWYNKHALLRLINWLIICNWIIQIKICAEYRDMLPRPRLVCQEPGLRPIGRSPGVPDKSSRGLGSMSRYSAQILIWFIAYIFLFCCFLCGFGWELCRTAIMHSALCHCPL